LKIEQHEEIRRYREEEERRVAAQSTSAEARIAEARLSARREAERHRQQRILDSCLHLVRMRLFAEPSDARAEVEHFLARRAVLGESVEWIKAECNAILDRRRAERDALAQRTREEERQRVEKASQMAGESLRRNLLLAHGEAFVHRLTSDRDEWDANAADEALEEVREHLADIVEPTWTEKRIEREVRNVLGEWD
jgi:hypothetical protein